MHLFACSVSDEECESMQKKPPNNLRDDLLMLMNSTAIPRIDNGNPNKQISVISDYNWTNTRLIVCVPVRLYCCLRGFHGWEQVIHVRGVGLAGWKQTSMCATVAQMLKSRKLLTWHYQTNRGQEIKFGWLYERLPLLRPCWVIDYSQLMSSYIIHSMYISPTHSVFLQTAKPYRLEFKGWMEIKSFIGLRTYDRPWQTLWIWVI